MNFGVALTPVTAAFLFLFNKSVTLGRYTHDRSVNKRPSQDLGPLGRDF